MSKWEKRSDKKPRRGRENRGGLERHSITGAYKKKKTDCIFLYFERASAIVQREEGAPVLPAACDIFILLLLNISGVTAVWTRHGYHHLHTFQWGVPTVRGTGKVSCIFYESPTGQNNRQSCFKKAMVYYHRSDILQKWMFSIPALVMILEKFGQLEGSTGLL